MVSLLDILLVVALVAVVVALATGVVVFTKGGELNRRWSVTLMSLRVGSQAVALVALGLLLMMRAS